MSKFQSTRPVWGATREPGTCPAPWMISIHAPRMGRDEPSAAGQRRLGNFNPRAPYGARPRSANADRASNFISIHAPRMGRDSL